MQGSHKPEMKASGKGKKTTEELERIILETHPKEAGRYLSEEAPHLLAGERPFAAYMRERFREKKLKQQDIFLEADIPERYGYKLISEEKRTKQRDVILRICYGAGFTLSETQQALRIYGMPELYARVPRDAVLMIAFHERPGSIIEVNALLHRNGFDRLRSSGIQD